MCQAHQPPVSGAITLSYGVVPKGLLTFLGLFLCNAEFNPCWALPEYIPALIYLACLRVFSVTPWVVLYRLYRVRCKQSD